MNITKDQLLAMYRIMVRIREFENQAIELAKMNITRAACSYLQWTRSNCCRCMRKPN